MTTATRDMTKPCAGCPWLDKATDVDAITPGARAAAERGDWFACQVHMGTCHGAARVAAAAQKDLQRRRAAASAELDAQEAAEERRTQGGPFILSW